MLYINNTLITFNFSDFVFLLSRNFHLISVQINLVYFESIISFYFIFISFVFL